MTGTTQLARPRRGAAGRGGSRAALAVAVLSALVVTGLYLVFVRTETGQRADQSALVRVTADPRFVHQATSLLHDLTIGVAVLVLVGCVLVAVLRRRWAYALGAVLLVGGANATTELLKHVLLPRPDLGYGSLNSLPSGHTSVTTSLLLATALVVPAGWRGLVVLVGSVATTLVSVGMVVNDWHRPSDVLAAMAVSLCWAGLVGGWLLRRDPGDRPSRRTTGAPGRYRLPAVIGAVAATALVYAFGVQPDAGWRDLVVYAATLVGVGLGSVVCLSVGARIMPVGR